jgi:Undecaprenyl-phosphate glucose phosphotransferase
MLRRSESVLLALRVCVDVGLVCLSWVLAYWFRFYGPIPAPKGLPEFLPYLKLLPFMAAVWMFVYFLSGFYWRRHRTAFLEGLDIIQTSFWAGLALLAFLFVYDEYQYSRLTAIIFLVISPGAIIFGRSVLRKLLRRYRRTAAPRRVLLIVSESGIDRAVEIAQQMTFVRTEIVGAVAWPPADAEACTRKGITAVPEPADWAAYFSQTKVQSVIVAVDTAQTQRVKSEIEKIAIQVPDVRVIPDIMAIGRFAPGVEVVNGVPVISIHESPLSGWGAVAKRGMDVVGSIAAILIFSPVMLIVALLVKLSSRGPVFYRQERMGLDGKTFAMLKFRSMPVNSEAATGPVWASKGDLRPTWIGRILRKSSLDELPQFFNVLRGEMSLVGPRPERPVFVDQFRRQVPGYYLRHSVKAGCTGWAQVNGWRGNTSIERRIECDLYYIQNWSLWLDLRIIFMTVIVGFFNRNAY